MDLSYDLAKKIIIIGTIKLYSLAESISHVAINEALQEGIGHRNTGRDSAELRLFDRLCFHFVLINVIC